MEALEWDASLKVGSREITDIHKWQGLKKQLTKSLQSGGKVCPFNETQKIQGSSTFCNTGEII